MMESSHHPRLTRDARKWRALNLTLLPVALFALAWLPPSQLPGWLPFATSCGAITGLPCIFCGTTRALHCLLEGEFGRALYFSRLPVPSGQGPHYHHVGIYAFRRKALARFVALPPGVLEQRERLEQLRALEAGMRIDVALVDSAPFGVDTPADLARARAILTPK